MIITIAGNFFQLFVIREVSPTTGRLGGLRYVAIREVFPTGSGDVFFAVMLHNLKNRHFSLAEAVADAIPCASANASNYSIAEINMN